MHSLCLLGPSQAPLEVDRDCSQPQTIPRLSKVSQPVKRPRTQVSWLPGLGMAPALAVSVPGLRPSPSPLAQPRGRERACLGWAWRTAAHAGHGEQEQELEAGSKPVPQPGRVAPGGPPRLPAEARATAIGRRALGRAGERAQASGYSDRAAAGERGRGGRSSWPGSGWRRGPRAEGRPPPSNPRTGPFLGLKGKPLPYLHPTPAANTCEGPLRVRCCAGLQRACKNGLDGVLPKLASN